MRIKPRRLRLQSQTYEPSNDCPCFLMNADIVFVGEKAGRVMLDITRVLEGWDYVPDNVTVRIITGDDGKEKIQMRLDLGLLQMEYEGRPDGKRPNGCESLLDYYEDLLEKFEDENETDDGFILTPEDCALLRSECLQYYYRYLSLFHLQRYKAVERDTDRNLRAFDFLRNFADEEADRYSLEQYRPYVIMMNTRAGACQLLERNNLQEAIDRVKEGIDRIKAFFKGLNRPELAKKSSEVLLLVQMLAELEERINNDPLINLREKMKEAVAREDFETAALLRDEIRKIQAQKEA